MLKYILIRIYEVYHYDGSRENFQQNPLTRLVHVL